jgi:hypothetical protein
MTHSESVVVDIEDIEDGEDIELIEAIEPGSLEWFRLHAPLPLLLRAFFEDRNNRVDFCRDENETAKSACKNQTKFWDMLGTAKMLAGDYESFDDPNGKAIAARLRALYGG